MTIEEAEKALDLTRPYDRVDIRKAFKEKAKTYHPDKHAQLPPEVVQLVKEKFLSLKAAQDCLLNPQGEGADGGQHTPTNPETWPPDIGAAQALLAAESEIGPALEARRFSVVKRIIIALEEDDNALPYTPLLWARLHAEKGEYNQALSHLEKIRKTIAGWWDDHDAVLWYGQIAIHAEDKSSAREARTRIRELCDGDDEHRLAYNAMYLLAFGDAHQAEKAIERLAEADAQHPLVLERQKFLKVGGNYVSKSDAGDACCICVLLECIFDCL